MGGQITYFVQKRLKCLEKVLFFILNLFSKSSFLISTFTLPLDYQTQEKYWKSPLFAYGCINQGVKDWLFLGKYPFKVAKVKDCKIK